MGQYIEDGELRHLRRNTLQRVGQEGKRDISCVTQRSKFFGSAGVYEDAWRLLGVHADKESNISCELCDTTPV